MNKKIYSQIVEILYQFMDLEISNNIIWCGNETYATTLLKECGYEVTDWSWYDGPIVQCNSTEYPDLKISYAACANSYCIHCDIEENYINVQIEEVGKLASVEKRSNYDFDSIKVKQQISSSDYDEIEIQDPSPEFNSFIKELFLWKKTFDKPTDYDYTICIYLGKEVNLNEL